MTRRYLPHLLTPIGFYIIVIAGSVLVLYLGYLIWLGWPSE